MGTAHIASVPIYHLDMSSLARGTRFLAAFFCLFLPCMSSAVAQQSAAKGQSAQVVNPGAKGLALAESGRCGEAMSLLKRAIHLPGASEQKRKVGLAGVRCAMTHNDPDSALEFVQVLTRDFPRDADVLYMATHVFSDLSMRASTQLLQVAPASYQIHQLNAEALETQGKWDDAVGEYRKVLEQNPHLPGIHYRLGRLLLSKPEPSPEDVEKAKKEFQAELEIDPRNAGAEYVLGEIAREANDWPEAITHFSKATKLDNSFAEAFLGLGMSYVSARQFPDAVAPLEAAVKLAPANPTAHYQLSIAYNRVGRTQDAEREEALHKQMAEAADQANKTPGVTNQDAPK